MDCIQITELDDEVFSELKSRAKKNRRTLENEIRLLIADAVRRRTKKERYRRSESCALYVTDDSISSCLQIY